MKKWWLYALYIVLLLTTAQLVSAGSIRLLAASESSDVGSLALGSLELKPGSGKVYIETNILSKEDTQISVRLAKEFICANYAECDDYDFFYRIDSQSYIVSGPSGGAAIALLTYAELNDLEISTDLSVTGTINSGGYIGNVGGLLQKVRAAEDAGIKTVYVPFGNTLVSNFTETILINQTIPNLNLTEVNLSKYGKERGVEVIEVRTFDDVLYYVYGIEQEEVSLQVPEFYYEIMGSIAGGICNQTNQLLEIGEPVGEYNYSLYYSQPGNMSETSNYSLPIMTSRDYLALTNFSVYYADALRFKNQSDSALSDRDYYSAASFCFSSNLKLRYLENLENGVLRSAVNAQAAVDRARTYQKYEIETINDLQIYAVVEERLRDAEKALDKARGEEKAGRVLEAIDQYSYAEERAQTAISWSEFYEVPSTQIISSNVEQLSNACILAIADADTRLQYLRLYYPIEFAADETLQLARNASLEGDYPMCVFYALRGKAEADSIVSVFGASDSDIDTILDVKESIAQKFVARQYAKGQYPILSYSYLEYANSLREQSPYSALIYLQMAQELSNLDIFLDIEYQVEHPKLSYVAGRKDFFWLGFALGMLLAIFILFIFRKRDANILQKRAEKRKRK